MNHDQNKDPRIPPPELASLRMPPPTDALKRRVLREGHNAWAKADLEPEGIPWMIPILRLAACIAIGWGLGVGADFLGKRSHAKWRVHDTTPVVIHGIYPESDASVTPERLSRMTTLSPKEAARRFSKRQREIQAFLQNSATTPDPS